VAKKISGAEYPLAKIFSSEFEYIIPSYQRPYAWMADQTLELFDDLYEFYASEQEEGYFLGTIVLIKEEGLPKAEVIDGQQRLTTLTILLATLTASVDSSDRDTLYKYIMEPGNKFEGLAPKPRLTLRERDKDFFGRYVQQLNFDGLQALGEASLENESQKNIQINSRMLLNRINSKFGGNPQSLQNYVIFLLQRCFLVAVSTPNQQSAFRIFSVMNSRGLDLQPTDIIKADVIGKIHSVQEQETYNERWEEMEVELGRSGFNDLFVYVRMIYAKEKAKRALLDEFRTHVLPSISSPHELVGNILEPYADALSTLKQCNYQSNTDAQKINNHLQWLNRIDFSDWIPPAMQFLAKHKDRPTYVLWFFERLERLAAFMHLCGYNVNERIERAAQIIRGLESEHSLDNPIQTIELTDQEKVRFRRLLSSDIYNLTARRRNYLILRTDSFISDGAAYYDSAILTIEHVLPQTVNEGNPWAQEWPDPVERTQWVHKLANLVPLNKRRNSQAQNYAFDVKKNAYFAGRNNVSSYALTSQVLNESVWTPETVKHRQKELLNTLKERWKLGCVDPILEMACEVN